MLYDNQIKISNDIYNSLEDKELFNIPTGTGKTFILLDVAKKAFKNNKKVIISAPTNQLVIEFYETAKNFGFFTDEISIVIGYENYIDRDKLIFYINSNGIFEYVDNTKEELFDFLDTNEYLLFDDFNKIAKYKDIALKNTVKNLVSKTSSNESLKFDDITITNHYFLLHKTMRDKSLDLSDYVVLVDEVHLLGDVAESILSEKISIFDLKNSFSHMKSELGSVEFAGSSSFLKNLQTLILRTNNLQKNMSNPALTGSFITGLNNNKDLFNSVQKLMNSREFKLVTKKAEAISKNQLHLKSIKRCESFLKAISNPNLNENSYGTYYSPSLGYPSLMIQSSNPLGVLNKSFWSKLDLFAGVSATTTCSFKPDVIESKYAYERLGMVLKSRTNYKITFYDRVFPKELVNIYLPDEELETIESVYDEDFNINESEYFKKILKTIYETYDNKNSIVLCGGYKEAKVLHDKFKETYPNKANLLYANPSEKTTETISKFKKDGGILFAVRNYNTGISLKGKALEKLYILKFPFVDFTSKKWQEMRNQSIGKYTVRNEREMLITLMQTLGRLQRSPTDSGDIFILDSRYKKFNASKKNKIIDICKNYGVISDHRRKDNIKLVKTELEDELESLLGI